jgi:hypothetical protein
MKLDPKAFGMAAGTITAAFFLICSTAYRLVPDWYTRQYTLFMHVDLARFGQQPSWGQIVLGVIGWWIAAWALTTLAVLLYNRRART